MPWRIMGNGRLAPLNYCWSDIDALRELFVCMAPFIDLPLALMHSESVWAAAIFEYRGTPIDMEIFRTCAIKKAGIGCGSPSYQSATLNTTFLSDKTLVTNCSLSAWNARRFAGGLAQQLGN